MGYNNPAFVDDDNKSTNTRTSTHLDEKFASTNASDSVHETTVNEELLFLITITKQNKHAQYSCTCEYKLFGFLLLIFLVVF